MVKKEELYFDSRDGQTKIHAIKWIPEGKPTCILQIIHGMAEYANRYDDFAMFLAEKNCLVTAEDHLGHGESAAESDRGYFCEEDASIVVVRDVHRLKKTIQEQYPGVPYFILGHSMGSFILRNYLCRYGTGINGAIIMGTGKQSGALVNIGLFFTKLIIKFEGPKYKSPFIDKLVLGSCNKKIKDCKTEVDWISRNEKNTASYIKDELCGFKFTLNGFQTLFELIKGAQKKKNLKKMPKELPILFVSGAEDPIGNYGKGVAQVYNQFTDLGMQQVQIKMYEEERHEILNEVDKDKVYKDLFEWIMQSI